MSTNIDMPTTRKDTTRKDTTRKDTAHKDTARKDRQRKITPWIVALGLLGMTASMGMIGGVALAHGPGGGFFKHFSHGGPVQMLSFVRQLDLREDQLQYLDNLHQIAAGVHDRRADHHGEHAAHVAAKLTAGERFEAADARALVDGHIEQARATAYAVTDELVAFLNSLDEEQRALLAKHLDAHAEKGGPHGHGLHHFFHGRSSEPGE